MITIPPHSKSQHFRSKMNGSCTSPRQFFASDTHAVDSRCDLDLRSKRSSRSYPRTRYLICDGDYALPKLLSYYELLRVREFMATVTTQVNTSGSDQVSDGDNDDLTKLVATLQSVVNSECEQARSTL